MTTSRKEAGAKTIVSLIVNICQPEPACLSGRQVRQTGLLKVDKLNMTIKLILEKSLCFTGIR